MIKFLKIIKEESKINSVGFYDLSHIAEKYKLKTLPRKELVKEKIRKLKYTASDTHFAGNGIRSDAPIDKLIRILSKQ